MLLGMSIVSTIPDSVRPSPGDVVEVSGYLNSAGDIVATYIELEDGLGRRGRGHDLDGRDPGQVVEAVGKSFEFDLEGMLKSPFAS